MSGQVRLFVYCWPNDDRTLLLAESRDHALQVLREDLETDRELAERIELARFYEPNLPGVLLFASLEGTEFNLADASWQLEAGELLDEVLEHAEVQS